MLATKIRTAIIPLVASLSVAGVTPAVSQARERIKGPGKIEVDCYLKLTNGTIVWEPEGSEITVYDGLGNPVRFKCVNGGWVMARTQVSTSPTSIASTSVGVLPSSPL